MRIISRWIDKRIANYQRSLIETHYNEVDNMYRTMRGWKHDYRNHIQTMKYLLEAKDDESLKTYLNHLDEDLHQMEQIIKTGNKMTDAILNSKISLAKSKDIRVLADGNISIALTISEIDLCIVIGNLMENAIEASMKVEKEDRLIRIYIDMKNTQLYMSFTNLTSTKKRIKMNGRYKSSKGEGHGLGLVRVDDIVARYGGYINRNSEDGVFTTEVLLPQR